jgi:membrane protease YdiL (CAAX protease family)
MIIAGTSATVVAAFFVHATGNRRFIRDFWTRAFDVRRIGAGWWLFIISFQLIINVLSILLSTLWGGDLGQFEVPGRTASAPLIFAFMTLLYGPLPEELGWRGYGLDALRSRMNLLQASLLLGFFWGLWHLPLHFMPGSFQQGLLAYPPALIAYVLAFFPGSIIMGWVYYKTGRSTLSAIMIHYFANLSGEVFSMDLQTRVLQTAFSFVLAGIILYRDWPMFTQKEFWVGSLAETTGALEQDAGRPPGKASPRGRPPAASSPDLGALEPDVGEHEYQYERGGHRRDVRPYQQKALPEGQRRAHDSPLQLGKHHRPERACRRVEHGEGRLAEEGVRRNA